jgi:hypothetical protein
MFIRKKKNRSGTTSIVVVNKIKGCFQELKTIGVSSDEKELAALYVNLSGFAGARSQRKIPD